MRFVCRERADGMHREAGIHRTGILHGNNHVGAVILGVDSSALVVNRDVPIRTSISTGEPVCDRRDDGNTKSGNPLASLVYSPLLFFSLALSPVYLPLPLNY